MRLYLVQHGESMKKEENKERPLSEKGRRDTEKIAKFLAEKIKVSYIVHSKKNRARQTAEIFSHHLGVEIREEENLEPLADPNLWVERLNKINEDIMIVGHLPHLSKLSAILLLGSDDEILEFKNSGVVCLHREDIWKIEFIITPELV